MEKIEFKDLTIELTELKKNDKTIKYLKFSGKISNENGFELNKKFPEFFEDGNYNIILDLSDLSYINSTGIAIIFSMFFRCQDNNGKLIIGGIHDFIKKVLAIMTLPDGFKIYSNKEEALNNF
ncbi:MAG: anti-sigma factor antagonist [Leptospiraceae bacterium]|nr:MAG: anti-sigma factor antagonist [Leptospiraceae bacterium]